MDKKLTDNEIVKEFQLRTLKAEHPGFILCGQIVDLINRLQAEIEGLEAEIDKQYEIAEANVRAEIASGGTSCHWCEDKVRAEAYKEFAERLKDKHRRITDYDEAGFGAQIFIVEERVIDNLLKELVGDNQ